MKLILDCNILISAGLTDGTCRKVVLEALKKHKVFLCQEIIDEYQEVISRDDFAIVHDALKKYANELIKTASLVKIDSDYLTPPKLPDPKDEIYLACALAAEVNAIVTGNIKHFPEKQYSGVQIITPKQFLQIVENF